MSLLVAERLGSQTPVVLHQPPDVHSLAAAEEAIELADAYGICDGFPLAESQKITLRNGLGERADGSWAAATIADFGPRQGTGKNDKIAARELAGLILFGERLIIHTAHEFPTANESFLRLVAIFENYDDLRRKVSHIRYGNGEQAIELLTGQRLKYKARTGGSGRGFAKADLIVYDEAQHLKREHMGASGPSKLANPNAQTWLAGSGGLDSSEVAWDFREKAILGTGKRLAYTEMTGETIDVIDGKIRFASPDADDVDAWYRAMPGLGRWVAEEGMRTQFDELGPEIFARECLCVWDPLPGSERGPAKLPTDEWAVTAKGEAPSDLPVDSVAFDVDEDGKSAAIGVGMGSLVEPYVEQVTFRRGVDWLPQAIVKMAEKWRPSVIGCKGAGPAGAQVASIESALKAAGIRTEIKQLSGVERQQACGGFYTDVTEGRLTRMAGQTELDVAGANATERLIGEAWEWNRNTAMPISPLWAVTIARALLPEHARSVYEDRGLVTLG